jgi:3-phenylpropionate/cinnamic acid dioxygenase small subunit
MEEVSVNSRRKRSAEADELAIRNLVAKLAHAADHGEIDEYVGFFTEDASWEMPDAPRRGRAEIRAGAEERRRTGLTGLGSASRHVISTIAVDLAGEDAAVADSYFIFFRQTTTNPTIFNMGHYHDDFRFVDGEWRLARRRISIG